MILPSGYLQVIMAMLIWGSVGIFVRLADQPAPVIVWVRVATAFVIMIIFLLITKTGYHLGRNWKIALLSGLLLSLNWLFFFMSIQTTTIGNAVLTYYFAPVFAIIWARLFLTEKLEKPAILALCLATAGLLLMMSGYEFSLTSKDFIGILYGLTAALFYSLVVIIAKWLTDIPPSSLVLTQVGVASLFFLPAFITAKPAFSILSLSALLTMGIFHSALALGLYFSGLKKIKVQHASILSYIDPASALVFAFIAFGEIPGFYTAAGGLLILTASFIIIRSQSSGKKRSPSSDKCSY